MIYDAYEGVDSRLISTFRIDMGQNIDPRECCAFGDSCEPDFKRGRAHHFYE